MNKYYELGIKLALDFAQVAAELLPIIQRELPETATDITKRLIKREINSEITERLPGYPESTEPAPMPTPARKKMRPISVRR